MMGAMPGAPPNFAVTLLSLSTAVALAASDEALNGRWMIEPLGENAGRVLWLEVNGVGRGPISGFMVGGGPGGQLDPIHDARIERGQLQFHLERRFRRDPQRIVRTPVTVAVRDGLLHGVAHRQRNSLLWIGRRAPVIRDRDDGSWKPGRPVVLFGGKSTEGWHTLRPGREDGWYVEDAALKNHDGADVLVSDRRFWNFRLEADYRVHAGMNGGIGLRGRYEIQILDDHGQPASDHGNGALYGRIAPSANASRPAGEWQTLDARLVGRELSVTLNGVPTIERQVIDGFTAMATDWREDQPGPISLQGDHGAVEFRRIVITPLEK